MGQTVCGWLMVFVSASAAAAPTDRYVQKLSLPDGRTAVIAEGDYEARSIGSYAVRLYTSDDTTFFSSGVILQRDGTIEDVRLADLEGKGEATGRHRSLRRYRRISVGSSAVARQQSHRGALARRRTSEGCRSGGRADAHHACRQGDG